MEITKDTVLEWLERSHHSRNYLAGKCGVGINAVNNWLGKKPRPIPSKAVLIIENLMRLDEEKQKASRATLQNLVLNFNDVDFENICKAGIANNETPKEWATIKLNEASSEDLKRILDELTPNEKNKIA